MIFLLVLVVLRASQQNLRFCMESPKSTVLADFPVLVGVQLEYIKIFHCPRALLILFKFFFIQINLLLFLAQCCS